MTRDFGSHTEHDAGRFDRAHAAEPEPPDYDLALELDFTYDDHVWTPDGPVAA